MTGHFKREGFTIAELKYLTAFELVQRIDADLGEHIGYALADPRYRNKDGTLLHTLDQVVQAILADDLMPFDEAAAWVWWVDAPSNNDRLGRSQRPK